MSQLYEDPGRRGSAPTPQQPLPLDRTGSRPPQQPRHDLVREVFGRVAVLVGVSAFADRGQVSWTGR